MNKKTKFYLVLLTVFLITSCGSVMKNIGQLAGNMMTSKTADLSVVSVNAQFIRNVYPADAKTFEVEYLGENWREGANMVSVNFLARDGIGMYSIDGKIFIDGTEVPHTANGFYGKWLDANDISPKTIRIETVSGQVAEFIVTPPPPIEIVSVNGKKQGAEVNINADMALEMRTSGATSDTEFSVALVTDTLGVTSFLEFGVWNF